MDEIKFRRKLGIKNTSYTLIIPTELKEWVKGHLGKHMILVPKEGKFGKYIAIYPEDEINSDEIKEGVNNDSETTEGL